MSTAALAQLIRFENAQAELSGNGQISILPHRQKPRGLSSWYTGSGTGW